MLKKLMLTTALAGLMIGSAFGAEVIKSQKPDQYLASQFKGTDVLGTDNQKIGDVTDIKQLAHFATAQGKAAVEIIAGHNRSWDKVCVPAVCFTDPEIVTAGLSPDEAKSAGFAVKL